MFLNFRKIKTQLRNHILLDFTYTRVIFLAKDTPLPISIATVVKKTVKNLTSSSFCLVINLLFSVRITLLGPLVFFLNRYGLIVFKKKYI